MAKDPASADSEFEANVHKKLQLLNDRQDSIQTMSLWVIHHKAHCTQIAAAWMSAMKKAIPSKKRLTLFYLLNDILQNCKRKNAKIYLLAFKPFIKDAILCVRAPDIRPKVERMLAIWEERTVFPQDYMSELKDVLAKGEETSDTVTDQLIDSFKPSEFSSAIVELKRYEDEVALKHKQLPHVHLDATSVEATKAPKDRSNSKQFAVQFEESCVKMEEYVAALQKEINDRVAFIEKLEQAQLFYETQWNESQVVERAYKNFFSRVKNYKKRLAEFMQSRQGDSAVTNSSSALHLSASADAPSPGQTPPTTDPSQDNVESIDMDLSDEEADGAVGGATSVSPPKPKASDGSSAAAAAGMPGALRSLPTVADRLAPLLAAAAGAAGSALSQAARLSSSTTSFQQQQHPATTVALSGTSPAAVAALAAGSSPAAAAGALKPVVYDPRQMYNPAYHLQPKSSAVTVPAAAAAAVPSAAAIGSLLDNAALLLPLSKFGGATGVGGGLLPPPLPVQPPLPPMPAIAPATTATATSAASAGLTAVQNPTTTGSSIQGIDLLRKLINQAGASPSQSASVLETLTTFAQTVKAQSAAKKDGGGASGGLSPAASALPPPASWSDWKKKQVEQDEDGGATPETSQASSSPAPAAVLPPTAPGVGKTGNSTDSALGQLMQPQRPVLPVQLQDRSSAGLPSFANLPGTPLPRLGTFQSSIDATFRHGAPSSASVGGLAPLAPPPPLPVLLSSRMSVGVSPKPATTGLPAALLPPVPPSALLGPTPPHPPFDVAFRPAPIDFALQSAGRYLPTNPSLVMSPDFESRAAEMRDSPTPPPLVTLPSAVLPSMAIGDAAIASAAATQAADASSALPPLRQQTQPRSVPSLPSSALLLPPGTQLSASPAVQAVLAKLNLPSPAAVRHVTSESALTPALHQLPPNSAVLPPPAATRQSQAAPAELHGNTSPVPAAAGAAVGSGLPPAILAVLNSGLSRSKDAPSAVTDAAPLSAATHHQAAGPAGMPLAKRLPTEADSGAAAVPVALPSGGHPVGSLAAADAPSSQAESVVIESSSSTTAGSSSASLAAIEASDGSSAMEMQADAAVGNSSCDNTAPAEAAAAAAAAAPAETEGGVGAGPPEEFYPIQSIASIRKPDHFDRRFSGGGHFRRDARRGGGGGGGGGQGGGFVMGGGELLPSGLMGDFFDHRGNRGGMHRPMYDFGAGMRRGHDHYGPRGSGAPYGFRPF